VTSGTPCSAGNIDPNDWFIERDGKQYRDDDILTHAEMQAVSNAALEEHGEDLEAIEAAIDKAEAEAKRRMLIRRRKAREACFECPLRLQCFDAWVAAGRPDHGIWGGYYPEQLAEIRRLMDERERRSQE
jgi:hypothetical protein